MSHLLSDDDENTGNDGDPSYTAAPTGLPEGQQALLDLADMLFNVCFIVEMAIKAITG